MADEAPDRAEILARYEADADLVSIIARQVKRTLGRNVELDDLQGYGREGLLDAARRFDPTRGIPFRAYANFRVRGAVIDGVREMSHIPRRAYERLRGYESATRVSEGALEDAHAPRPPGETKRDAQSGLDSHLAAMATAMATGLVCQPAWGEEGERTAAEPGASPEEAMAHAELYHIVVQQIATLPDQERELVQRHYIGGERFDHVAADLGLSKSWASRLHTRAMTRLSKRLITRV